jgi:hypothetical protein
MGRAETFDQDERSDEIRILMKQRGIQKVS